MINTQNTVPNAFGPMINLAENWSELVKADWEETKYTSSLFADFPVEPFPLFQGDFQQFGIWRQGLSHVMGLTDFKAVTHSRAPSGDDPGISACDDYNPKILNTGGQEIWRNEITRAELASPAICVNDLRGQTAAPMQTQMRVDFFLTQIKEYGVAYRREQYIRGIVRANHGFLMNDATFDTSLTTTDNHWYYDPDTLDATLGVPCLYFKAGDEVGALNIDVLIDTNEWLASQAPSGASGTLDGMPTFTWYGDSRDMEKMIRQDTAAREDFRYAEPTMLTTASYRKFRTYRGITIAHDLCQMRFEEVGVVTVSTQTAAGVLAGTAIADGRGGYLPSGNWVKCARVNPERESDRTGLDGFAIVEANPAYFRAPLRLLPAVLNNTMTIQVGTKLENIASMQFGPQPGYNGEVKFLVYPESEKNPFGEKGAFYARYELGIKPEKNYLNMVGYLYRSCQQNSTTLCSTDGTAVAATALRVAAAAADIDITNKTATVTLASALKATAGTQVDVVDKGGTADGVDVYVVDATLAPTYVLGFSSMDAFGLSSPSAATFAAELTTVATVAVH